VSARLATGLLQGFRSTFDWFVYSVNPAWACTVMADLVVLQVSSCSLLSSSSCGYRLTFRQQDCRPHVLVEQFRSIINCISSIWGSGRQTIILPRHRLRQLGCLGTGKSCSLELSGPYPYSLHYSGGARVPSDWLIFSFGEGFGLQLFSAGHLFKRLSLLCDGSLSTSRFGR
jgi:hypothetical protein